MTASTAIVPEYGEPILRGRPAQSLLADWKAAARKELLGLGLPWDKAAEREVRYRFCASEAYLGKLTAKAFAGWCQRELKIQTKDGRLVPFRLNLMQYRWAHITLDETYLLGEMVRQVILKARQFGFSTAIQALLFFFSSTRRNCNATTIAHKKPATDNLHAMAKRYLRNLPYKPRTERSNKQELIWAPPHDARIALESAEVKEAGRSLTNLLVHASEVAFWKYAKETRLGLMQTVADVPGTFVFEESTANGMGGPFYEGYWRAKNGNGNRAEGFFSNTKALFFAWWENPAYSLNATHRQAADAMGRLDSEEREGVARFSWTPQQILWRRFTIADKCDGDVLKFHQEYPSYDQEAFLTSGLPVFDQHMIAAKRMREMQTVGPLFQGLVVPE